MRTTQCAFVRRLGVYALCNPKLMTGRVCFGEAAVEKPVGHIRELKRPVIESVTRHLFLSTIIQNRTTNLQASHLSVSESVRKSPTQEKVIVLLRLRKFILKLSPKWDRDDRI